MWIKLQFGLHHQCQRLMATAEVHRPRRDQDRQALARDDHAIPRIARTKAATRLTATSSGTFTTRSAPISIETIPINAFTVSGARGATAGIVGSPAIDRGTKAGSEG